MNKLVLKLDGNRYWLISSDSQEVSGMYVIQARYKDGQLIKEIYFLMRAIFPGSALEFLHLALDPIEDMNVRAHADKKSVLILSYDSFKNEARLPFETDEEMFAFWKAYEKYHDKRWDEMPCLDISLADWQALQERWVQIKKDKPKYIIFVLDDSGPLDKVEIIEKDELSEQDVADMKAEYALFLKYEKARQIYRDKHPDYSYDWRGPQDDEYDADIMKYYDQD